MAATLSVGFKSLILRVDPPVDPDDLTLRDDLVGIRVWYSTTNGFDPATQGTLAYDGAGLVCTINGLTPGVTYYVKYSLISEIDTDYVSYSEQYSGVPSALSVTGYLTNDSAVVATAADGTGGVYTAAGGTLKVFDDVTEKTGNVAVTYSVVSGSVTAGLSISIASTGVYTVTGLTVDSAVATLRAVYQGVTIDKVYSIAKAKAGAGGSSGARGSQTFYDNTLTSAAWSATKADAKILAVTGSSTKIAGDTMTQVYSTTFAITKYWNGTAWTDPGQVIDGNLVVTGTLSVNALKAETIRGRNVTGGAFMSLGGKTTASVANGATTITLDDVTDFPNAGYAFLVSQKAWGGTVMFHYTGRNTTTKQLTGCTGVVLSATIAAGANVVPENEAFVFDPSTGQLIWFGDTVGAATSGDYGRIAAIGLASGVDGGGGTIADFGFAGFNGTAVLASTNVGTGVWGVSYGTDGGIGVRAQAENGGVPLQINPTIRHPIYGTSNTLEGGAITTRVGTPTLSLYDGYNWQIIAGNKWKDNVGYRVDNAYWEALMWDEDLSQITAYSTQAGFMSSLSNANATNNYFAFYATGSPNGANPSAYQVAFRGAYVNRAGQSIDLTYSSLYKGIVTYEFASPVSGQLNGLLRGAGCVVTGTVSGLNTSYGNIYAVYNNTGSPLSSVTTSTSSTTVTFSSNTTLPAGAVIKNSGGTTIGTLRYPIIGGTTGTLTANAAVTLSAATGCTYTAYAVMMHVPNAADVARVAENTSGTLSAYSNTFNIYTSGGAPAYFTDKVCIDDSLYVVGTLNVDGALYLTSDVVSKDGGAFSLYPGTPDGADIAYVTLGYPSSNRSGYVTCYGNENPSYPGQVRLFTTTGAYFTAYQGFDFLVSPGGSLIVRDDAATTTISPGVVMTTAVEVTDYINAASIYTTADVNVSGSLTGAGGALGIHVGASVNDQYIYLGGGGAVSANSGGSINLYGNAHASAPGRVYMTTASNNSSGVAINTSRMYMNSQSMATDPGDIFWYINNAEVLRLQYETGNTSGRIKSLATYNNVISGTTIAMHVDSTGQIGRLASAAKYKYDIQDIEDEYIDNVWRLTPRFYKSKNDSQPGWGYWGLIAEEVSPVDPRLVCWAYPQVKEWIPDKPARPAVIDEFGTLISPAEPAEEGGYRFVEDKTQPLQPEGVHYDRLPVLLLAAMKKERIANDQFKLDICDRLAKIEAIIAKSQLTADTEAAPVSVQ